MGSFFTDILSFQHETAVFDVNPHQLRFVYNTYRFTMLEEIKKLKEALVRMESVIQRDNREPWDKHDCA